MEEVFSNEGDDDDDDGREKEENEKKLTVEIVKGAETADADDDERRGRRLGVILAAILATLRARAKRRKSNDNDNNNRWEWQRQFDNPFQFMGHFKKAPAAEEGKEKHHHYRSRKSSLSPIVKKTMKEEKDATSAGANWIPDARAFLMHLPLPPLVGIVFLGRRLQQQQLPLPLLI